MLDYKSKVFLITFFSYMGVYAIRTIYSFSKSLIAQTIQVDDTSFGLVDSLFIYSIAFGYFLLAIFPISRPVLALIIGLFLVSLFYMLIPILINYIPSQSFSILCILMSFDGYFQSWTWPHLLMIINNHYDNKQQSVKIAFWTTNSNFGSILGFLICQFLILSLGFSWQICMLTICIYLIFMVLMVYCIIQQIEIPAEVPSLDHRQSLLTQSKAQINGQQHEIDNNTGFSHTDNIMKILKSPVVILMTIIFSLVKSIQFGIMFWLPLYFVLIGLVQYSAYIPITYDAAGIISSLALGFAFSKINNKGVLLGPVVFLLIIFFALLRFLDASVAVYFVLVACVGICLSGAYNALAGLVAIELVKVIAPPFRTKYVGFYTAVLMCFGNIVTGTFQIIIGVGMNNNESLIFSIFFWLGVAILILLIIVGILQCKQNYKSEPELTEQKQQEYVKEIEITQTH